MDNDSAISVESQANSVKRPAEDPIPVDGAGSIRNSTAAADYPRKRVSVACEVCRIRKTRCDARRPACSFCVQSGATCEYRTSILASGNRYVDTSPDFSYPRETAYVGRVSTLN
jgi:hypothetical protein